MQRAPYARRNVKNRRSGMDRRWITTPYKGLEKRSGKPRRNKTDRRQKSMP